MVRIVAAWLFLGLSSCVTDREALGGDADELENEAANAAKADDTSRPRLIRKDNGIFLLVATPGASIPQGEGDVPPASFRSISHSIGRSSWMKRRLCTSSTTAHPRPSRWRS